LLNLKTVIFHPLRAIAFLLTAPIFLCVLCTPARADDKEKKVKEKKERPEVWVEIRTPDFIVMTDGGEKTARKVLDEFEQARRVFQATMPNARLGTGIPIRILAARDSLSFPKLMPEFPPDRRRTQPNGQFIAGPEKIHIAIRTNVSGKVPYEEIYQDYARQILKVSYRNLPPWLQVGFEDVYGSMMFTEKGAQLGRPDPEDMSVLFESPLLPLDLVLHVDHTSPYYTAGDKNTVFFAESKALVHFLLSDPQMSSQKVLDRYFDLVEHGGDAVKSARQAFGDLGQLQSRLDAYIKLVNGPPVEITIAGGSESVGAARTLSAAEADARIGEFWANRGRRDDAQSKLEDALTAEPTLALAEQSLGFLMLQQSQLDEADKHFTKAVELDPNDGLTYYGRGLVAMSRAGLAAAPPDAVNAFEKSVSLNPDFAPGWFYLSSVYSSGTQTLRKALAAAQRAVTLAPGVTGYQSQLASIQDRLKGGDDGKVMAAGQGPSKDAKSSNDPAALSSKAAPPAAPVSQESSGTASAKPPTSGRQQIQSKPEPEEKSSVTTAPAPPLFSAAPKVYSMIGTISEAVCANAPQIQITLKALTIMMHLHADDLGKITFNTAGSSAPAKNPNCAALRGRTARVTYLLATDKSWDGEIQAVEFRSLP
jgi:tetratricopeptide (TPR) repeat protein